MFTRPSEGWHSTSEQRLLSGPDSMRSFYSSAISISGDVIVVGASDDENENGPYAGSAFLFMEPAAGWDSDSPLPGPATLRAFDGPAGDRFGHSVAVESEMLVVGVPGNHHTERGRANLFIKRGSDWDYVRVLNDPDGAGGGRFGSSVALSGNTVVVGAPGRLDGDGSGASYVFVRPDDLWGSQYKVSYTVKLTMPDDDNGAWFGYSVAVHGDIVVVGAPGADAAYVFKRPASGWVQVPAPAKLTPPNGAVDEQFGHAVAISGDTIVVGAPGGEGGKVPGKTYIFSKPDEGWVDTSDSAKFTAYDGSAGDQFGYATSMHGDTLVVGAPGIVSGDETGATYVLTESDAGWTDIENASKLTASDGSGGDRFGHAVSVSNEFIVVGAPGSDIAIDDEAGTQELEDSGAVYTFRRPKGGWTSSSDARKLTPSSGGAGDTFGYAVSMSGDTLAVSSPSAVVLRNAYLHGSNSGTVQVFAWPGLNWTDTPAAFKVVPPNAEQARIFGVSLSADGNSAVVGTVPARCCCSA